MRFGVLSRQLLVASSLVLVRFSRQSPAILIAIHPLPSPLQSHHHVYRHRLHQQAGKGGQESNDVCQGSASRRQAGRIAPRLVPAAGRILLSLPPHNVEENPLRCLNLSDWHRLLLLRWSLSHPLCCPPSRQAQRYQRKSHRHVTRQDIANMSSYLFVMPTFSFFAIKLMSLQLSIPTPTDRSHSMLVSCRRGPRNHRGKQKG